MWFPEDNSYSLDESGRINKTDSLNGPHEDGPTNKAPTDNVKQTDEFIAYDTMIEYSEYTKENTTSNIKEKFSPNKDVSPPIDKEVLKRRFVYVYYETADQIEFTSDRLFDLSAFIGTVGGTLGLYLGFSFLGIVFAFLEKIERMYEKRFMNLK